MELDLSRGGHEMLQVAVDLSRQPSVGTISAVRAALLSRWPNREHDIGEALSYVRCWGARLRNMHLQRTRLT